MQHRSGGFVHDTEHVKSCDISGILCGLPLGVVEVVGRNSDNGMLYFLPDELLTLSIGSEQALRE